MCDVLNCDGLLNGEEITLRFDKGMKTGSTGGKSGESGETSPGGIVEN